MLYDEQEEVWKPINFAEYGNQYLISNKGRVFSIETGRYLRQTDTGNGMKVSLKTIYGKWRTEQIDRLVCSCFIPNPNHYPQVRHQNGIKADNNAVNLEWYSVKEVELETNQK